MKKSVRMHIKGTFQAMFFDTFIKENADRLNVRGYHRKLEDGRIEVFLEGDSDSVNQMMQICKTGDKHSKIISTDEKQERFQDFKDFKIIKV